MPVPRGLVRTIHLKRWCSAKQTGSGRSLPLPTWTSRQLADIVSIVRRETGTPVSCITILALFPFFVAVFCTIFKARSDYYCSRLTFFPTSTHFFFAIYFRNVVFECIYRTTSLSRALQTRAVSKLSMSKSCCAFT